MLSRISSPRPQGRSSAGVISAAEGRAAGLSLAAVGDYSIAAGLAASALMRRAAIFLLSMMSSTRTMAPACPTRPAQAQLPRLFQPAWRLRLRDVAIPA